MQRLLKFYNGLCYHNFSQLWLRVVCFLTDPSVLWHKVIYYNWTDISAGLQLVRQKQKKIQWHNTQFSLTLVQEHHPFLSDYQN